MIWRVWVIKPPVVKNPSTTAQEDICSLSSFIDGDLQVEIERCIGSEKLKAAVAAAVQVCLSPLERVEFEASITASLYIPLLSLLTDVV